MGAAADRTLRDFQRSLPMELLRAREATMARFRPMLREHGLTEQQWRVIRALASRRSADATELAQLCFLLAPSLTRILQFLERGNILSRLVDERDQRRAVFELTGKGKRIYGRIGPDSESLYSEIEREFGREKLDALYALLSEFYSTLASPRSVP